MAEDKGGDVVSFAAKKAEADAQDAAILAVAGSAQKLAAFARYIEDGMVMVTIDARPVGVKVPAQFRGNCQLNLNFSHRFFLDDFEYDDRGVRASLSFSGTSSLCDIPWPAVWMIRSHVTGEVALAPDDVPDVLRTDLLGPEPESVTEAPTKEETPAALSDTAEVGSQDPTETADDGADDEGGDDEPPRGPPKLTLVKSS